MHKRFLSIWFPYLTTDRLVMKRPELKKTPFILASPERGRMMVQSANPAATSSGIYPGMVVADARAMFPGLEVLTYDPNLNHRLLNALAEWCLRYTPVVGIDSPDGLILEISGCPHLWGGEQPYLESIIITLKSKGYHVRGAIADSIGAAWAVARYEKTTLVVKPREQREALLSLPPTALRLEAATVQRLEKLGFHQIAQFINIPYPTLRKRFGETLTQRLDQALGIGHESLQPVEPRLIYREELPCLESIRSAIGIQIALKRLLESLCKRLSKNGVGMRTGVFKGHRLDGKIEEIRIGTGKASCNPAHLFRLFDLKIPTIAPDLGIELFILEAPLVEPVPNVQEAFWHAYGNGNDRTAIAELLDRLACKTGEGSIRRYLPQEHHWPERSIKAVSSLDTPKDTEWQSDILRPLHLLPKPEPVEVMVPLPDYPPLHFRHKGKIIQVAKADGPERIEQEWWLQSGPPRDYYCIEDAHGARYWLFRLGLYGTGTPQWFLHGFFA